MPILPAYSTTEMLKQRNLEYAVQARRLWSALENGDRYLSHPPSERVLRQFERGDYARAIELVDQDLAKARRSLARLAAARERLEGLRPRLEWSEKSSVLRALGLDTAATRAKLLAFYETRRLDPATAAELADSLLGPRGGSSILSLLEADSERLATAWQQHLRRLAMDHHLMAAARFNQLLGQGSPPAAAAPLQEVVAESRGCYDGAIRALREFARGEEFGTLGQYARFTLVGASRMLSARLLPALAGACQRRNAASDGAARQPWAGLALDLSTQARRTLLLLSILRVVEARATWPLPSARQELMAAARCSLRSELKLPDSIGIRRLLAEPDAHLDALVRVEGRLASLEIAEEAGKAISRMQVEGTQPGETLSVELHGIKADSGGMVPGASVILGGMWRKVEPDPGAAPGAAVRYVLMLGRFSLQQAAEKSWEDWLAWETSRVYQAVSHGLMAEWSWEPGLDGAANPVRYGVWAREE